MNYCVGIGHVPGLFHIFLDMIGMGELGGEPASFVHVRHCMYR